MTVVEKFLEQTIPEPNSGCWLWIAGWNKSNNGYGVTTINGAAVVSHRASWLLFVGEIPRGLLVLHTCDTPPCVNPGHLFLGTTRDNALDRARKGRGRNGEESKTHCPQGHPYNGDNLYIRPRGDRQCRVCLKAQKLKYYHAQKVLISA